MISIKEYKEKRESIIAMDVFYEWIIQIRKIEQVSHCDKCKYIQFGQRIHCPNGHKLKKI